MNLKEYINSNGETVKLPEGSSLRIEETSNSVYRIDLFDNHGRNVGNHGTDLDEMIEQAIIDFENMGRLTSTS